MECGEAVISETLAQLRHYRKQPEGKGHGQERLPGEEKTWASLPRVPKVPN